jgi:predicted anti-sigma-YlaC factor YlaD
MECEEVSVRLWEYLDDELDPEDAKLIEEHLGDCFWCRPSFRCGRAFLGLLARQRGACMTPRALVIRIRRLIEL